MNRQQANKKIIKIITSFIENNPDIRFGKLLYDFNILEKDSKGFIIDPFYDESIGVLERMENSPAIRAEMQKAYNKYLEELCVH